MTFAQIGWMSLRICAAHSLENLMLLRAVPACSAAIASIIEPVMRWSATVESGVILKPEIVAGDAQLRADGIQCLL